jgi:glycosyltransferase involved in cell wall biosynthesis
VFPNVALEAMACATPCVVSTHSGVDELIVDGQSGFVVPPEDPAALSAALARALALPHTQRESIGRQARLAVEHACAAPTIAAQTIDGYRTVLTAGREKSVAAGRS